MSPLTYNKLKELLAKLKQSSLSESEFSEIQHWITESDDKEQIKQFMESHWQQLAPEEHAQYGKKVEEIYGRILSDLDDNKRNGWNRWYVRIQKIAAVLILPLLMTSTFMYLKLQSGNEKLQRVAAVIQTVEAAPGVRSHFFLPDSSEVWLNSQSRLEFSSNIANEPERRLKLIGQGYFNVKKDNAHPFIVETQRLSVKVLGTSFDLSAYEDDNFVRTTLEKGRVEIQNCRGAKLLSLDPGEQSYLDVDQHKIWIKQVETSLYTSWKDGTLLFRETPLKQTAKLLERWFNCEIILSEKLLNSEFTYTGTIHEEVLDDVLKMIQMTTPIKYSIKNRDVTIW